MHRQLNSPEEIFRRLLFVLYIFCWTGVIVTGTIGLLQGKTGLITTSVVLLIGCLAFHRAGKNHLDFRRLSKSFPLGNRIDEIPQEIRTEAEELFRRFSTTDDWQERQEIRLQLAVLVEKEAVLLEIYEKQISRVHANLLHSR